MSEHAKPSVSQKGNVDTNKIDQIAFSKGVNLDEQTSSLRVNTKRFGIKDFFEMGKVSLSSYLLLFILLFQSSFCSSKFIWGVATSAYQIEVFSLISFLFSLSLLFPSHF